MEEPHKAVIWFVAMILVLMVVLSLIGGYNFTVVAPQIVLAQNYKNLTVSDSEMMKYILQLPVTINSSALTTYFPEYILISNGSGENVTSAILHILSMNASLIAPGPYWEIANLAGLLTANATSHKSFLIGITNGTSWNNIIYYNITLPFFNARPLNISYPPSDNILIGSPTYRIVDKYSVSTSVQIYYKQSKVKVGEVTKQKGNNTVYVYQYYGYIVIGIAYLLANGQVISSQSFSFFVWPQEETFKYTIYGNATVPPGVSKQVFANYSLTYHEGSDNQTNHAGNTTIIIIRDYPVGPYIQTYGYTYNWYEYNVSVPIHIIVYNGTNPRTQIGNSVYNSRNVVVNYSFIVWSSAPQSSSTRIITYDYIQVGKYTIERTWDAGSVGDTSKVNVQQSGNTINYYLTFSMSPKVTKQPSWVFRHVPQPEVYAHNYAYEFLNGPAYYYALAKILLENFSTFQLFEIAHGLQSYITLSNSSWLPAASLRFGNGSIMDVYYQIMPLLFTTKWHNFTSENVSILVGAFSIKVSNRTIIIENKTATLTGIPMGMLLRSAYANVSTVLRNSTYTFYEWLDYVSPPILFKAYPVGNYSVKFLF